MTLNQTMMVRKIDPRHVAEVAGIFQRTDSGTTLPRRIGVRRRDLFEYHGTCLHLVQCDQDFIKRLREERNHPEWRELDQALRTYLFPSDPASPGIELLTPFYTWIND
ncbi:MAG: TcmI family type II polyketide cyclase [Actinobacteria bacterium]|nr:TcmI family type II polyketide cyclase [Actinomycetota bacterium]